MEENHIHALGRQKYVHSEKFALIFQVPICQFIENQNYFNIIAALEQMSSDSQRVVQYFCTEFAGTHDHLRKFERYSMQHFLSHREESVENPLILFPF